MDVYGQYAFKGNSRSHAMGGAGVSSFLSVPIPADLTSLSSASEQEFTWDYSARNETDDWFGGAASDTSNLVIPGGIHRITIQMQINWQSTTATDNSRFRIRCFLNETSTGFGPHFRVTAHDMHGPQNIGFIQSALFSFLEVHPGDILDIRHRHDTGGLQDILSAQTYVTVFGFRS